MKIRGTSQVLNRLKRVSSQATLQTKSAVVRNTDQIYAEAVANVPVLDGYLRGSGNTSYQDNETDWDFHFASIYGVSKPFDQNEEEVQLLFTKIQAPYIITKPLHETQKHYEVEDGLLVKLSLIPNFELEQLILSFGDGVKVITPIHLKEKIVSRIQNSLVQYTEK